MPHIELGCKRLNDRNYATWSVQMKFFLMSKDAWSAIDGTEEPKANVDQKALSIIGLCVEDHLLATVHQAKTAKEAWQAFERDYKLCAEANRLHLRRDLASLKKEGNETMAMYFSRARGIKADLLAAGDPVDDDQVSMAILAGLPSVYDTTIAIMKYGNKKLKIEECFANLVPIEQKEERAAEVDANALAAFRRPNKHKDSWGNSGKEDRRTCYYCGAKGHIKPNCSEWKADVKELEEQKRREQRRQQPTVSFATAF
jgi:gag-polypeptide of LTR copia-type/Zinc knuckle